VTIANCYVHPSGQSAILATDSQAVDLATGSRYEISKLWVLTRWHAVLVCRGLQRTSESLFCSLNFPGLDFDTAFEHMGAMAQQTQDNVLKAAPLPAGVSPDEAAAPNVVLVAWREGRIRARAFNGFSGGEPPVYDIQPGRSYLTPSDEAGEIAKMPCSTSVGMEAVARRQCDIFRDQAPMKALGSWLHIARVTESHISVERVCNPDEPARPRMLVSTMLAQLEQLEPDSHIFRVVRSNQIIGLGGS